jgi:formylglycine-generating enzyme required for sulfatase activity
MRNPLALRAACPAALVLTAVLPLLSCQQQSAPPAASTGLPTVATKLGIEMVSVPAGKFLMGSADGQPDERPPHEVTLDAFLIDRAEITQEQFGKVVLGNPSHFKGPDRPVEQISWAEAARFCNERSKREGLEPCYNDDAECNFKASGYRLPTEAEWEYACRAGATSDYYFGPDPQRLAEHAWYGENGAKTTHPVAAKKPNAWGLYDMLGNVAEWCNDVYDEKYYASAPASNPTGAADGERYVLRGGAWNSGAKQCRSSSRVGENPGFQDACFARDAIGFRCVRRAEPTPKKS